MNSCQQQKKAWRQHMIMSSWPLHQLSFPAGCCGIGNSTPFCSSTIVVHLPHISSSWFHSKYYCASVIIPCQLTFLQLGPSKCLSLEEVVESCSTLWQSQALPLLAKLDFSSLDCFYVNVYPELCIWAKIGWSHWFHCPTKGSSLFLKCPFCLQINRPDNM